MAKGKRNAVDDLLGDQSPILGALARQATQERPSDGGGVVSTLEAPKVAERAPVAKPAPAPAPTRQIQRTEPKPRRKPVAAKNQQSKLRAKRMKITPEEERTLDELVTKIADLVGARVQYSHVARAMWELLLDAEATFEKVPAPVLERPANADQEGLAEFEGEIKVWLIDVIQRMPRRQR